MRIFRHLLLALLLPCLAFAGETGNISSVDNGKRLADSGITMEGYRGFATGKGAFGVGTAAGGLFVGQIKDTSSCLVEAYGGRLQGSITSTNGGLLCPVLLGGDAEASHTGTGDVPYVMGMRTRALLGGVGSTTDELGGHDVEMANGGGTAALAFGLRLPDVTGLGTTSWAIMSLGGNSFHVGRLTLGSVDPPTVDAILDLDTVDAALLPTRQTTAQRDALTPAEGMLLFNTDNDRYEQYALGAWGVVGISDHGLLTGLADNDHPQYGLVASALSQFAATTSAQLAGVLSDETGFSTGALAVFNIDPTIQGISLTGSGTGVAKLAPWASSDAYYALGMAGSVAAGDYTLMSSPGDTNVYLNAPTGKEIRFRINNATQMALAAGSLDPGAAGGITLGRTGLGWGSIFVDSLSTANTLELTRPTIASNIQVAWPASAGTLALTSDIPTPDAFLTSIAALGTAADRMIYTTGVDTAAELTTTAFGRGLLGETDASTTRTTLGLVIGTNVQAYDADLTSWAGVTRAAGFDTFAATPSSANLISLVTDESGTGALVFANTPTLVTPNTGAATGTSLTLSSLTAGRVAIVGTAGLFEDDAGFLYDKTTDSATLVGSLTLNTNNTSKLVGKSVAGTQEYSFYVSSDNHWVLRANIGGATSAQYNFSLNSLFPTDPEALGTVNNGWESLFLEEPGGGDTAQIIAPALGSDIVLTTPAATGTLARTDGDAIGATTASTGRFTTLALTSTENVLSNLKPTDNTYTLGDSTHRWGLYVVNNFYLTRGFANVDGIVTQGAGLAYVIGENISATKTANFTALTLGLGAVANRYLVSAVITTTSATNTGTLKVTVDYVDSQGTTHTGDVLPAQLVSGASSDYDADGTVTSAASKEFVFGPKHITTDASATSIVVKVVITGTVSYTVAPLVEQVS